METAFFLFAIFLMVVDCYAVASHRNKWRILSKPAPMIVLIIWFSMVGSWQGNLVWFGIAMVLSLLGDIFLLFPFRFFIAGLGAFSLAQVFYIIGLNSSQGLVNPSAWLIPFGVGVIAFLNFRPIVLRIQKQPSVRKLLKPVLFYAVLLSLMLGSGLLTLLHSGWNGVPAVLIAFGSAFFFTSDSILAREKFIHPSRYGGLLVMVTYFLGQLLLATGSVMNSLGVRS
jgi:uncharacterized membrane protein YhhN